jgi:hypothetical protein
MCIVGGRSFVVFPDAQVQDYAWMQKRTRSLHRGHLALWNPNTLAGHSFPGEMQAGVFYPPNVLWALAFGSVDRMSARSLDGLVLFHFALAGLGMFLLLRAWDLSPPSSLFGAIVFTCLGPLPLRAEAQLQIFYGLCWAPWVLWAATRHFADGKARHAVAAGSFLALQVLAGHAQPAFHTAVLLAALGLGWMLSRTEVTAGRWWRLLRASALVGGTALLVAGPQLLLSAQYLSAAYRWVGSAEPMPVGARVPFDVFAYRWMLEPGAFLSLVDPWGMRVDDANTLYVGSVVLLLIVWLLATPRARAAVAAFAHHGRWLLVVAAIALVCVLGHNTFVSAVLRVLPVVGAIRELGRYVILFHFAMSALAAMAFEALRHDVGIPVRRRNLAFWLLAAALAAQLAWMATTAPTLLSPTAVAQIGVALAPVLACFFASLRRAIPALVVAALAVHVVAFSDLVLHRAAPGQDADTRYAGGPITAALDGSWGRYRIDVRPDGPLPQNYADAHQLQDKLGHGATMYRPYFDFLARDWSEDGTVNDLLNVRYLVTGTERPLRLVAEDAVRGLRLYERAHWYPRVFLQSQITERPSGDDIERAIGLDVELYDDDVQRFRFTATAGDRAIVSEIAYPGWCATVNGRPVEITRATIGSVETPLRSVPVQPGENVVEFRYRPFRAMLLGCN